MIDRVKPETNLLPFLFVPSPGDFRKKAAAASTETEYSDLLRDLAVIKLKLETMGYGPVYLEGPYDDNGPMAKSLKGTIARPIIKLTVL